MKSLRNRSSRWVGNALLGGAFAVMAAVGCSANDEPESGDDDGEASSSKTRDDGEAADGGTSAGGVGQKSWVAGGWVETADAWYGVLGVVDDLSSNNALDLDDVVSFDGDFTFTSHKGAIYVGLQGDPRIEKWEVNEDGKLEMEDDISFMGLGVQETHGASHNVIQVIDDDSAWFFDHKNARAIVFDPSKMRTAGKIIDYEEIYEGLDLEEGADWPDIGDIGRVGDYLAVPMFWYSGADGTIPLETRVALIHTQDESVTIIKDKRCAGSSVMSNDSEGNLYFGPHAGAALYSAAGDAGDAVPCVIRILSGEMEIDQDYLVELNELSDNKATSGLYQGPGDLAFIFQFEGDPTAGAKARFEDIWTLYSFELGAEDPKYTKVKGWPEGNGLAQAFSVKDGDETKHYLTSTTEYGAKSAYYQLLSDGSVKEALKMSTYPGIAVNH